MISEKTLQTLELDKIVIRVQEQASFSAGKEAVANLRPATNLSGVTAMRAQTDEARRLLDSHPATHLGGAHDVREAARRAEVGAVLTPLEFLDIAGTLSCSARIRSVVLKTELDVPWLLQRAQEMVENRDLTNSIDETFSDTGEVLDSASPTLRRIRHDSQVAQSRLIERLNSMVASAEYRTALQDPVVSMRNGRYVIPVKNDARSKVPGIVHDQSASGQTVFVEPLVVTEMNNRLKELQLEEEREIERILTALSGRVAAIAEPLRDTVDALSDLDVAFAKAKYAQLTDSISPRLNSEGRIVLNGARHPLLTGEVVPTSVWLGEDFRLLVITGPNTGGKTVALKTVGLLTVMAQMGMHIPASQNSEVAVFSSIFADVGDEQSIEQNLSTFSSHMRKIIDMLPEIDGRSLVLLDELGAGTDPAEGAALARAILETLLASGSRGIVTTHYSELKTFAHERDGLENASVEFDVETLSPTYRLVIGLPGRSQALAIAKRLGLPERVLEAARGHVSSGAGRVEELLEQIQSERDEISRLFEHARKLHDEARRIRTRARNELKRFQGSREQILDEAREEAAAAVRELRGRLTQIESTAKGSASRREQRETRERIATVQESAAATLGLVQLDGRDEASSLPITVGSTVEVQSLGQSGTVIELDRDEAEVQLGQFKMRLPLEQLRATAKQAAVPERSVQYESTRAAPPMEIDVRGWRPEDVVPELDQYLHDNYMHGQGTVRILHGKGTGALRRAIREQLSEHPLVRSFEAERHNLGGEGVTVVRLSTA